MPIKRFSVPQSETESLGLQEIHMPRLGRYIAIAGKNGAGKSRLLNLLIRAVDRRNNCLDALSSTRTHVVELEQFIKENPEHEQIPGRVRELTQQKSVIAHAAERVITDHSDQLKALPFVPKSLDFQDPRAYSPQQLASALINTSKPGTKNQADFLAYIQILQNRWWSSTHQSFSGNEAEKIENITSYESLKTLIQTLLGAEILRSNEDEARIFDRPLALAELSHGQLVILQLITALHAQKANLDNTVFVLDELENHLHPSASIEVLERLSLVAPRAQFWIATHSVPLLAYIHSKEPAALWYMVEGKISHAGRHPEYVLQSLLGDDTRIGQLNAFTGLPAQLAAATFASECLLLPNVAPSEEKDPQVTQISRILKEKSITGRLSVLDFGAGKGRLLEGLAATAGDKLHEKIDYVAFDESINNKEQCTDTIAEHFTDSVTRYFASSANFHDARDDCSIDVVVMCNVFHEISPNQWISLFSEDQLIQRALKEEGHLLLVEDQRIPVGEKAHDYGFLVLDTAQLITLFCITDADINNNQFVIDDERSDGRLKAHLIARPLLERITYESKIRAICQLREHALENIRSLRKIPNPSYLDGQIYGFWTQQLANAYMYLSENQDQANGLK